MRVYDRPIAVSMNRLHVYVRKFIQIFMRWLRSQPVGVYDHPIDIYKSSVPKLLEMIMPWLRM